MLANDFCRTRSWGLLTLAAWTALALACGSAKSDAPGSEALTSRRRQEGLTLVSSARSPGELRGVEALSAMIRDRLLDPADERTPAFSLGMTAGASLGNLTGLLGAYDGGDNAQFRNGEPNPFNLLAWHRLLDGVAATIADGCAGGEASGALTFPRAPAAQRSFRLRPDLVTLVASLCALPDGAGERAQLLSAYWLAVVGYEAPFAEYEAWRDETDADPATGRERLYGMTLAMLMNPYVLLGN